MGDIWNDPIALRRELSLDDLNFVIDKPPLISDHDDDEMNLLFDGVQRCDTPEVDPRCFNEISSMLDMVQNFDEGSCNNEKESEPEKVLIISKLNPNVHEFVPNNCLIVTSEENIKEDIVVGIEDKPNENLIPENLKFNLVPEIDERPNHNLKLEIEEQPNKNLLSEIAIEPKPKAISCVQKRKMRNAAISNILKNLASEVKEVKLMTPDDFINKEKTVNVTPIIEIVAEAKTDNLPIIEPDEISEQPSRDEIQESINIVESWLTNQPIRTTAPILARSSNNNSSGYTVVKRSVTPKITSPIPEVTKVKKFVPTVKSNAIYNKYVLNTKIKVEKSEDMWTRVQREMKERDEVIKSKSN